MNEYESHNPDVLSCLASLSNDEVFTPPNIASEMLDLLPKEIWSDPNIKILDPCCKSGIFLREAAKRFIVGLEDVFPDLQERVDHICKEQLYGIAITELTALMSCRSLYCSKTANGEYSICSGEFSKSGNIVYKSCEHTWYGNNCKFCGANKDNYDRPDDLEAHAYLFIHILDPEELFHMKFDVIIGNPPYQLSDGGQKASAIPIYHKFIQQAKKLSPRYLVMIIPARWYNGGRGLDKFRDEMLNDTSIRTLVDYTDSEECFPGVDIAGGVCYFLWDRDNKGTCKIVNHTAQGLYESTRFLNYDGVFIRYGQSLSIIEKVKDKTKVFLDSSVSSQKPFGLRTYVTPLNQGDIILRYSGGTGPYLRSEITSGIEWIDKWKVIMSYLTYDHAGRPDKDGKRRIISTMDLLPPGTVCTETYIVIGAFESEEEAKNCFFYLQTKFVRFLIAQITSTQHLSKSNFALVPVTNFKESWTDEKLFEMYDLTEEEKTFICSNIREMNVGASYEE